MFSGAKASEEPKEQTRGRLSIEAYLFFLFSAVYVVLSAFGITVSFWAGALVLVVMTWCATDLLWHTKLTLQRPKFLKILGTAIILIAASDAFRAGWVRTHTVRPEPEGAKNEALVNLIVTKVKAPLPESKPVTHPTAVARNEESLPDRTADVIMRLKKFDVGRAMPGLVMMLDQEPGVEDLQFTVLNIQPLADRKAILEHETRWKLKLGTRVFGLNPN